MTYTLSYCESCIQMTNHIGDKCQKCNTKYIKLEDANKIIQGFYPLSESVKILEKEINSLTSINLESMIEEMIEERVQSTRVLEKGHGDILHNADMRYEINLLKSILQKFKS